MKTLLPGLLSLLAVAVSAQPPTNYQKDALLLVQTISKEHFSPRPIDDRFSQWVFTSVLDELDPDRLYFTEHQVKALAQTSAAIDDDLKGKGWRFLPHLIQEYNNSLKRVSITIDKVIAEPFEFIKQTSFDIDTTWSPDENSLAQRWRQKVMLEMLKNFNDIRQQKKINSADNSFLKQHDAEARLRSKKAIQRYAFRLKNHPGGMDNMVARMYLKTIAAAFDPHTNYLSSTDMQNFMSSLSTKGLNFGFTLDENESGEIVVSQLTPGGPAWNSGLLNTGDVIKDLQWQGKPNVDVSGMAVQEVDEIMSAENQNVLTITVAKPGGLLQSMSLKKEMIENNENIVKSFILSGERKIGFISLPGFYTSWGDGGSQCANDVAREIMKLKKEGIEGLILDLRYNGGGSLQEAVALAGIFIDAGPVGVIKDKAGVMQTVKDINRGTVYDGPLVVMVNPFSASASEFVAAALQDYRRAIVVGGRTYGKATAQAIFPLTANAKAYNFNAKVTTAIPHASITLEKIYRVNGKTAQFAGVTPSIVIPDLYDSLSLSESILPRALPQDSIVKKTYYTPLPLLPIPELREKSRMRTSQNRSFEIVSDVQLMLRKIYGSDVPDQLSWNSYQQSVDEQNALLKRYLDRPETSRYEVSFHKFDTEHMVVDSFIDEYNKTWVKKIKKDISLEEGFNIICDYISITKREKK